MAFCGSLSCKEKWISLMPAITLTALVATKIKETLQINILAMTTTISRTWAEEMVVPAPKLSGKSMRAALAIPIKASAVKEAGPMAMNMPGWVLEEGKPDVMSRPM